MRLAQSPRELSSSVSRIRCAELARLWLNPIMSFIEGSPSEWDLLPLPDGTFKVGIDGGYVRNWFAKKHHFEVIVGKSTRAFGEDEADKTPSSKRFGFVQTLDTKPKRRLYEVLHSQGLQMNQEITFLSDGNDTLRALQLEMSPQATHIFDWFHIYYSSAEIHRFKPGLPLGIPCSHQHVEQGFMIPLDFRQVRPRTRIGKNDLPRGPSSQGPTDPLEAQRGFRQRDPRRTHLEPAGRQVFEEEQAPHAKRHTGQMDKAQDGQRRRTLVVPQAEMLLQILDGQLDRKSCPIELDDLESRQRQIRAHQADGLFGPREHHDADLLGDVAQPHVPDHEDHRGELAI